MEFVRQTENGQIRELEDSRRHPRYPLETEIRVYARNSQVVHGHTVDISESGISAILRVEAPIGEVVRLEFSLQSGEIDTFAVVRHRRAFRYGFQFINAGSAEKIIGQTCREFAFAQASRQE
jgi:hypothetical protein